VFCEHLQQSILWDVKVNKKIKTNRFKRPSIMTPEQRLVALGIKLPTPPARLQTFCRGAGLANSSIFLVKDHVMPTEKLALGASDEIAQ
jgi:hypothetical protein